MAQPIDPLAQECADPAGREELERQLAEIYSQRGRVPVPDPRQPSDPVFTEMVRLSGLSGPVREEVLEPYVRGWLRSGVGCLARARYFSAAGLLREEAEALEARVVSRLESLERLEGYSGVLGGLLLLAAAVWVGWDRVFPFWGLVLVLLGGAGLAALVRGVRLLRQLSSVGEG